MAMHDSESSPPPLTRPVLAAAAVLVAGFGAMAVLWWSGQWDAALPGFWDYRSATFGDAILLPVIAGVLVAAAGQLPHTPGEGRVTVLGAAIGVISGVAVVASWLLDPHPQLNWTAPRPHAFSAPGLYHAAFLIVASALFGALVCLVLWRARQARLAGHVAGQRMLASPFAAALVGAVLGFTGLLLLDNLLVRGQQTQTSAATLVTVGVMALAVVVVALLAMWAFGFATVKGAGLTLGWGMALAVAVWLFMLQPPALPRDLAWPNAIWLAGSILVVGLQLFYRREHLPLWWVQVIAIALAMAGGMNLLLRQIASAESVSLWPWAAWTIAIFLLLSGTCRAGSRKEREEIALVATTIAVPALILVGAAWLRARGVDQIRGDVLAGLLMFVFPLFAVVVPAHYSLNWQDERAIPPGPKLEEAIYLLIVKSIVLVIAALAAAATVAEIASVPLGIDAPGVGMVLDSTPLVVGIAGATALLSLAAAMIQAPAARDPLPALPERPRIDVPLSGLLLAMIGVAVWGWTPIWLARGGGAVRPSILSAPRMEGEPTAVVIVVSLLVSGWVGYTTYESLVANVADAEFYRLGGRGQILSVWCGIATMAAVAWLFLDGMWIGRAHGSMTSTLAIVALVALGNLLVTTGCGWCLARAAPKLPGAPWYVSLHHPAANVAHDLLLAGYFILCVAILRFGLALMPGSADSFNLAQNVFPAIGMVAALLGYAKAMRSISAEFVKSEARRASLVLPRRSTLPPAELRELWTERAETLGRRFDRKLTWSLMVSFVGLAPSAARTVWSIYADPASELQRVSRLSWLWLPAARRATSSGTIDDQADRQAEDLAAPEREARPRPDSGAAPSDYPG